MWGKPFIIIREKLVPESISLFPLTFLTSYQNFPIILPFFLHFRSLFRSLAATKFLSLNLYLPELVTFSWNKSSNMFFSSPFCTYTSIIPISVLFFLKFYSHYLLSTFENFIFLYFLCRTIETPLFTLLSFSVGLHFFLVSVSTPISTTGHYAQHTHFIYLKS